MPSLANLILNVTGNSADAQRSLAEVRAELERLAQQNSVARLSLRGTEEAQNKLRQLETSLSVIGARSVNAKVKVDVDQAQARIRQLRGELDLVGRRAPGARPVADILGDISRLGGDIDRVGRRTGILRGILGELGRTGGTALRSLLTGLGSVIGVIPGLSSLGGAIANVGGAGAAAGLSGVQLAASLAALGAVLLIIVPLFFALLGVLGALAASFAAAVAGAAVLALTFGAVLLPVIAVVAAGIFELVRAGKAAAEQNEKEKQAAQGVRTAREQLKNANERVADATQSVTDAQGRLKTAQDEAWRAYHDSVERVSDDLRGVERAQLGVTQANINVKRSAQELRDALKQAVGSGPQLEDAFKKFTDVDFNASNVLPTLTSQGSSASNALDVEQAVVNYKEALLSRKDAQDQVGDSTRQLNQDEQTRNAYLRDGINANDQYVAAVRALADARKNEARAIDDQKKAQQDLNGKLQDQRKVIDAIDPATRKLADRFSALKKEIAGVFGPIGSRIGNAVFDEIERFVDLLQDPEIKSALGGLTDEVVDFIHNLGELASSRGARNLFVDLTKGAAGLVRQLGSRALLDFLRIIGRLAEEALPYLLREVRQVGNAFDRWEEGTTQGNKLSRFVRGIVGSFSAWLGLIRSVARVLLAFFRDGKETGDGLVRSLTRMFNRLADFLNTDEGRAKVKEWLQDSVKFAGTFAKLLGDVLEIAEKLLPIAVKAINAFDKALKAYNTYTGAQEQAQDNTSFDDYTRHVRYLREKIKDAKTPDAKERARQELENYTAALKGSFAWGGLVPGTGGFGDNGIIGAEGGEYMVRRSVVQSVGVGFLDKLNAGMPVGKLVAAGSGGGGWHIENVNLPPAPAAAVPDARYQAVQLAEELKRRGG